MNRKHTKRKTNLPDQLDVSINALSNLSDETIEALHFIIDKEQARRIRNLLREVMPDYDSGN